MQRAEKPQYIENLNQIFAEATLVVVVRQLGLTVTESSDLRSKMREVGARYKVTKNTLARLAVAGTPCAVLAEIFNGPTAIAAANDDPIALAKAAVAYAKGNDKFEIAGGVMDGRLLTAEQVQALSKLPSLDQLRGQLIGLILAPATKIAGVCQAPAAQLARVFNAYATKES